MVDAVRLDKWLWAARLYKTRALAGAAVGGGKVHLQGRRVKPSHRVAVGECYELLHGYDRLEIVVTGLSRRRGSADEAATLYAETDDSVLRRERETEQRRLAALSRPRTANRPDKKQRRQIRRFNDSIE